jgi:CBS domain-containing protein
MIYSKDNNPLNQNSQTSPIYIPFLYILQLPLVGSSGKVVGMISIKDLVKTVVMEKERTIKVLSDFALGKGGHYGSE